MKKLYYLIVLALILGLVLTGCLLSNVGQVPTSSQSGTTYLTKNGPLPNLVGLWHFDGNALDSSVNSNDGDVHGATYIDGKFGKALNFDGVDDYVDCGNDSSLDLSTLTIEAWIKPDVMKLTYILSKAGSVANNKNYFILLYADGSIRGDILDTTGTSRASAFTSAEKITTDSWYHIAYTYDGYVGKFYINGVLKATSEIWSGTVGTATIPFYIGQRLGGYFFNGVIDEVRIWDGALTDTEIAYNYSLRYVEIDIKPGSDPNSINLGSNGVVPVAILGLVDFDAATVNPLTVTLAGADVRLKGKSGNAGSLEDVNEDGYLDLVVQVYTQCLELETGDAEAVLNADTYEGGHITGSDWVRIVPPE